jgi:hypothetical protein
VFLFLGRWAGFSPLEFPLALELLMPTEGLCPPVETAPLKFSIHQQKSAQRRFFVGLRPDYIQ